MNGHPERVDASTIGRALKLNGYFRRSMLPWGGQRGHKEWLHFAVHHENLEVLANFSLVDDLRPSVKRPGEHARIVCLVREQRWTGDIDHFGRHEVEVRGGHLDVRFAENHVLLRDGLLDLKVQMRRRPIAMRLTLEPLAIPSQLNNIQVDDECPSINWLVIPRVRASGWVQIGERRHELNRAPAYHDHNWGYFRWGKNFAWEWGYAAPNGETDPWTIVFVRLSDRSHLTDLVSTILLWKNERQHRVFRAAELTVWHDGLLRTSRVFKLPRVMGLACPANVTDVPKRLLVRARRDPDWVELVFESEEAAQVIIPNDDDMGVTVIHEVAGIVRVQGCVGGEPISIQGPSIFEFLGD